ncbi:MAG: DnaJ family domain-containing protein [Candidatus Competibacteraceae bacterium]
MNILEQIAEARIQEAIERGELRKLPGEGKPLQLDDDSAIPEELRAAYRILKNSGFLPPELQLRKELRAAEQLLQQLPESERSRARIRLELLQLRLAASRRQPINLLLEEHYRQRLLERLDHAPARETPTP